LIRWIEAYWWSFEAEGWAEGNVEEML